VRPRGVPGDDQLLNAKSAFVRESLQQAVGEVIAAPIVTSTRFRYRLLELLADVVSRTDEATVARLGKSLDLEQLAELPLDTALQLRNFWCLNTNTHERCDIVRLLGENVT